MGWPKEAFLNLRQILTPKSRPAPGGNLLYVKADNELYLLNADGTEHLVGGGGTGDVNSVVAGDQITVDATDPANPIVSTTGLVESVVAGTNVTVDSTDPANPIVSATGSGASDSFLNTDIATVTTGSDVLLVLSHVPITGSEQVFYRGMALKKTDWTRADTLITVTTETWMLTNDKCWVDYAYDLTVAAIPPVITSPTTGSSTTATPTVSGTGSPGYAISVRVDGVSVGTTTVDASGNWSLTTSVLTTGAHALVARQTSPDTSTLDSSTVNISVLAFSALLPTYSPSLWWRLGDAAGITAADSSGNGHSGSAATVNFGVTGLVTGDADTAATLTNPSEIHVTAGYAAWMDNANISGRALFKTTSTDANGIVILSRWDGAAGLWIFDHINGNLRVKFNGTTVTTTGLTLNDGNKHAASFTYDGTTCKIYADGALVKTQAVTATITGGANVIAGADRSGGAGSLLHHWQGTLDEITYWAGHILTATEITNLWNVT